MRAWAIALAALFLAITQLWASVEHLFEAGNQAFLKQDYAAAIQSYEQALAQEPSAALHYNLGNALHAAGESGKAIAQYEKALALKPSLKEAAINLSLVRKALEMPLVEATPLSTLGQLLPLNKWVILLAVAIWIAVFGYVAPMVPKKGIVWSRTLAVLATLLAIVAGLGCAHWYGQLGKGVVLADDTPLLASPNKDSEKVAFAEAGHYVRIERKLPDFSLVETETGKSGFVAKSGVETLWQ